VLCSAKFNARSEKENDLVETYITLLHSLSEHCNFYALKDEMIRDCIVVGIRDDRLTQRIQLVADLTLTKAVDMACQSEAIKRRQQVVQLKQLIDLLGFTSFFSSFIAM